MPAPNTLLIEGTFSELADELAAYLDGLRVDPAVSAAPGATTPPSVQAGITPALDRLRAAETREAESAAAAAEGADNQGGQAGQKAKAAVEEEEEEQKQVLATRDEVMKKIVTVAGALNEGPEKGERTMPGGKGKRRGEKMKKMIMMKRRIANSE